MAKKKNSTKERVAHCGKLGSESQYSLQQAHGEQKQKKEIRKIKRE
ncbi:uncharacterized protein G2W53_008094 [Senna tora]|uniref:Uncharacterized protein n=1 Tax=Senna tora TaxID=362788 RepID=A0A835CHU7_9FABA|nr:uncharacterized protein G2W53_008094 [Senna tora]